jgi:hypothetical protein
MRPKDYSLCAKYKKEAPGVIRGQIILYINHTNHLVFPVHVACLIMVVPSS